MPSIVTRARFAVICVLGVIVASQPVKFNTKCSAMRVAISRSVGGSPCGEKIRTVVKPLFRVASSIRVFPLFNLSWQGLAMSSCGVRLSSGACPGPGP
jgi:hypothetical protein